MFLGMNTLQTYLDDNSLTQGAFAKKVGTTQATVSRWLDGQMPSHEMIKRVAKATKGKVGAADWYAAPPRKKAPPREGASQ